MSPFVKNQVLPRIIVLPALVIGYALDGREGVLRAAGLAIAIGAILMICVMWRPNSGIRPSRPLYILTIMFLCAVVMGLAMAGPLSPWLAANASRH